MTQASANVNIMIKAARKAGRGLLRDFGEVENLQVSSKGPGDFVSRAGALHRNLKVFDLAEVLDQRPARLARGLDHDVEIGTALHGDVSRNWFKPRVYAARRKKPSPYDLGAYGLATPFSPAGA